MKQAEYEQMVTEVAQILMVSKNHCIMFIVVFVKLILNGLVIIVCVLTDVKKV